MLLSRRKPDHIAGPDFLDRPAPALRQSYTIIDNQRLAEGMGVPCRACSGFERHARSAPTRRIGGLEERIKRVLIDNEPLRVRAVHWNTYQENRSFAKPLSTLKQPPSNRVDITAAWLKIRAPPHLLGALEVPFSPPKSGSVRSHHLGNRRPHYIANAWPHYPVLAADGNGSTIDAEEMRRNR